MKMKKFLALVLSMCMIFSMSATVFAAGESADSPETFIVNGPGVAKELTIPAGTTVYYEFGAALQSNLTGLIMEVTGSWNVGVQYGVRYYQPDMLGKISIELNSQGTTFSITNSGEEDAVISVVLNENTVGTMNNPFVIEGESAYLPADIAEGNSEGYWIKYYAPADGTFKFEMYGASDADYNEIGWTYFVNNVSAGTYGDIHTSDDETPVFIEEIEVSEGDEIDIMMSTYETPADQYSFPGTPAGTVTGYVSFTYPEGTENNPIMFEDIVNTITIPAGTEVYYSGRFGGSTVNITGASALDVYFNGTLKEEVNNKITIEIADGGNFAPSDIYHFVNDTDADVIVKLEAVYPEGHVNNPDEIEDGEISVNLAEGSNGYYFVWIAPWAGKLTVSIDGEGWQYVVNNVSAGVYGDTCWSDDDEIIDTQVVEVAPGDKVTVNVNTYDPEVFWSTPEGTLTLDFTIESYAVVSDDVVSDEDIADIKDGIKVEYTPADDEASELELIVAPVDKDAYDIVKDAITDAIKDKVYQMIDISMADVVTGEKVDFDADELPFADNTKITVTIPVMEALKDATKIAVSRYDETAKKLVDVATVDVVDGKITFDTDHFSTYVFADATPAAVTPPAATPDKTADMAPIAMAVVIAAAAAVVVLKKRETAEN